MPSTVFKDLSLRHILFCDKLCKQPRSISNPFFIARFTTKTNYLFPKASLINQRNFYSLYSEILHHAHFCQTKCRSFCGQDGTLSKIHDYIMDPSNRKPLIVYADSGAGKTSVMAMAMNKLKEWFSGGAGSEGDGTGNFVGVIRFLGTSPHSSDAYRVLFGLVGQLADITGAILQPQSFKTMKALASSAPRYIRSACLYLKRPVVVFLDSLDQLQVSITL